MAFVEMDAGLVGAMEAERNRSPIARVECSSDFATLAPHWLTLQAQGVATPYQTFDWARCWAETAGASLGVEPMLVAGSDQRGRVVAILPFGVHRRAGLTIASFLGGKHANLNLGLFDRTVMGRMRRVDVELLLRQAAGLRGVDVFKLEQQPLTFAGVANPMALLPRQPSSSSCWRTTLGGDAEALIRRLRSGESLKKLRSKARKLGEFGPVSHFEAQGEAEIDALLAAFLSQKAVQFAKLGVADPFADPAIQAFLRAASRPSSGRRAPVTLVALKAGERITAVFGSVTHRGRRSGMFISYDADPDLARHSPGDLLLLEVLRSSCAAGLSIFDLGAGDGAYKKECCPEEEPLFDTLVPMTTRGSVAVLALYSALAAKRAAKASPLASRAVERLRKLRSA